MNKLQPVKKIKGYGSWLSMHKRCRKCKRYIERGITVCERWKTARVFLADMGERPDGMTLERINNDLGYLPENCEWATPKKQARNRSNNKLIDYCGDKLPLSQVVELSGISRETLQYRIKTGRKDLYKYGIRATKLEMQKRLENAA